MQCQRDEDCPFDKTCKSNECVDPCPLTICGSRAQCKPERHKGICVCPAGLQGNPYVSCTEVGCQSHEDCSYDEKCDFPSPSSGRRECVRLCITPSCAQGARCEAKNHKEICTCNYPLQGDGYISCLERKSPMGGVFRSRFLKQLSFLLFAQLMNLMCQSAELMLIALQSWPASDKSVKTPAPLVIPAPQAKPVWWLTPYQADQLLASAQTDK